MKAIVNVNIVMPDYIIRNGTVVIDGEKIVDFGKEINTDGMETIDATGKYVGPGLIDIHTHAGGNMSFTEKTEEAANVLLSQGVTDVMPALYFSATGPELISQINKIKGIVESGKAQNIIGLYMEAPYMNPKFGADRTNNPWTGPIDKKDYDGIIKAGKDFVRVWCVAPEREGIEGFVKDAKEENPNAVFSVAHSEATPYDIEALMKYGLKLATHHTNATGTLNKYPECRGVCVDEAVLRNDDIYAELICDKIGIHVDPYMLRMVKKIKGDDRIILISDAFVSDAPPPSAELYKGADDINFDWEGEIAGTKIRLADACHNMMTHTGASICQAFKYASTNPARMLSLHDRGSIAKGNLANLIVTDAEFRVEKVFFRGNQVV